MSVLSMSAGNHERVVEYSKSWVPVSTGSLEAFEKGYIYDLSCLRLLFEQITINNSGICLYVAL